MKYILINECYGGFSFSEDFMNTFEELYPSYFENTEEDWWDDTAIVRNNIDVIHLYREKGLKWSSGVFSKIVLKEISDNVYDFIKVGEYDGYESITIDWKRSSKILIYHFRDLTMK
jgi:hypothetical protein